MRKKYRLLCDDYVSIIADGTSVSTFLCTMKTTTWRSECNCSLSTHIFDETEVLLQGFEWWLTHVWNWTTYYTCWKFLHHLYTVSLLYTTVISISCHSCSFTFFLILPESSCWYVDQVCVLLHATPINWPSPPEWRNFLNYVYNAYSRKWHKHIYIYIYLH